MAVLKFKAVALATKLVKVLINGLSGILLITIFAKVDMLLIGIVCLILAAKIVLNVLDESNQSGMLSQNNK